MGIRKVFQGFMAIKNTCDSPVQALWWKLFLKGETHEDLEETKWQQWRTKTCRELR